MPRAYNRVRGQAWAMWEASGRTLKLREIAEKLQIPTATIRTWKYRDVWDGERCISLNGRRATKKRRGGQPGNKNAAGAGAPRGNINAVKHGAYSRSPLAIRTHIENTEDGTMTMRYTANKDR